MLGFFLLSAAATGLGFADLRAANTDAGRLGAGELVLTTATTLFVVAAMIVALHNVVSDANRLWVRLLSFVFYLFFAVWTVGFGYGFFWKELAGQEFTERQFGRAIADIAGAIGRTSAQLETAEQATTDAARLAASRAETEAREGRTCANRPASTPGEGPLMRGRFAFADRARNLGDEVAKDWIAPIAGQRTRLQRRIDALVRRKTPAVSAAIAPEERATLDRLTRAARLAPADRRVLFVGIHEDARAFADAANALRATHAAAFADRLEHLAAEVGADPARPGSPDPARVGDPGYCWDVVLNERLIAAAAQLRGIGDVVTPDFEFIEGPRATRAAFFGLVGWVARAIGLDVEKGRGLPFGDKEFLALFASIAVDLGIVFLTIVRGARPKERKRTANAGQGQPTPPRLAGILEPAKRR